MTPRVKLNDNRLDIEGLAQLEFEGLEVRLFSIPGEGISRAISFKR